MSPAFFGIKAYAAQYFWRSSRQRLILGDDLGTMPYREYVIPFKIDRLRKISLAVRPLMSASFGIVGVEIVSSDQRVLAQVTVPLMDIQPDLPTDFILSLPAIDLTEGWSLRVFVRNVDAPVAVYEFAHFSAFGRRIEYIPFVAFE